MTAKALAWLSFVLLGAACTRREETWTVTKSLESGGSETIIAWDETGPQGRSRYCRQQVREAWEVTSQPVLTGGGPIRETRSAGYEQCRERLIETALTGVDGWQIERELSPGGRIRIEWRRASWWGGASRCRATVEKPGMLFAESFVEGTQPGRGYDLCLESMAAQQYWKIGGTASSERFTAVSTGPRAFLLRPGANHWTICPLDGEPQAEQVLPRQPEVSRKPYPGLAGYSAGPGEIGKPQGSQQIFQAHGPASWPQEIVLEPAARDGCKFQERHAIGIGQALADAAPTTGR